jgi:hypothetical protein
VLTQLEEELCGVRSELVLGLGFVFLCAHDEERTCIRESERETTSPQWREREEGGLPMCAQSL